MNEKPLKSKITETELEDGYEWELSAKRGVGCLMFFGILFCVPPLGILSFMLYEFFAGSAEVDSAWGMIIGLFFLSIFLAVGGAVFYFGYKTRYSSYRVRVSDGGVEVVSLFSKKKRVERLERREVQGVGLYSNSETNGKPDYGMIVTGKADRDIRFAANYREDELRWLASRMLTNLSQQGGFVQGDDLQEAYEEAEANVDFEKYGVKLSELEGDGFVLEKRSSVIGKSMILGGIGGALFSSVFVWLGLSDDVGSLIFVIVGALFMLISLITSVLGVFQLEKSETFTFRADVLSMEKFRKGVSQGILTHPKVKFDELKVRNSGSSNDRTRYSMILDGSRESLKLFRWVDESVMYLLQHRISQWLRGGVVELKQENEQNMVAGYGSPMKVEESQMEQQVVKEFTAADVLVYNAPLKLADARKAKWLLRGFLSLFILVGLMMCVFGVLNVIMAKESENWESVEGTITSSEISTSHGESTTYGADVSYRFVVDDTVYKGDKVRLSEVSTSNYGRAQKIVEKYPIEAVVKVFYDPNDPESNVLEPGLSGGSILLAVLGLAFLVIPTIMLVYSERERWKKVKQT